MVTKGRLQHIRAKSLLDSKRVFLCVCPFRSDCSKALTCVPHDCKTAGLHAVVVFTFAPCVSVMSDTTDTVSCYIKYFTARSSGPDKRYDDQADVNSKLCISACENTRTYSRVQALTTGITNSHSDRLEDKRNAVTNVVYITHYQPFFMFINVRFLVQWIRETIYCICRATVVTTRNTTHFG